MFTYMYMKFLIDYFKAAIPFEKTLILTCGLMSIGFVLLLDLIIVPFEITAIVIYYIIENYKKWGK